MGLTGTERQLNKEAAAITVKTRRKVLEVIKKDFKHNWKVYLMALPVVAFYIIFCYGPMWGLSIAFVDFKPRLGILKSPFVGLKHFKNFVTDPYFGRLVTNTFMLNLWGLVFGFPAPIILALSLNEVVNKRFKRTVQTITYMPHFISLVVVCGLIRIFCGSDGLLNDIIAMFGGERTPLLANANLFRPIYTFSGIWQNVGWDSIIYLAAISNVSPELYESATIDGAGRFRRMWHVTIPSIAPTITILLIFAIGGMLGSAHEKIILLYNPVTYEKADVIASYVYRRGLQEFDYSYSAAVGLISSVVNFVFLWCANAAARKMSETSLW
ncbi:ABC transporter permease subunit [Pseudoclostridium thermosuccinogenes]|uniref:ABC transporter permease n=1 Tax=Clostridium thermosuccinogenes TaxID=84032 RepID=UPI002FDAE140